MKILYSVYIILLFILLTPGVLISIPKGGSRLAVAATHGVLFAIAYYFTRKIVWKAILSIEGFQSCQTDENCKDGYRCLNNGCSP
jgi:hypothetical protein